MRTVPGLIFLILAGSAPAEKNAVAACSPLPFSEVRRILATTESETLFPELATLDKSVVRNDPRFSALSESASAPQQTIPQTTYTLYREFSRNGQREGYQKPYYDKRKQLKAAVWAYWILEDRSRLDFINDLLWNICEETTWVVPAHERGPDYIDLFSAETASELAHIAYLLRNDLPNEITQRIYREVKQRVLDPYLRLGRSYGWNSGRNNWTGVCAGSVGECFLLLEPDTDRVAAAVTLVLEQLDRFLQNGFEEDGGCLEGIGYWNYGLSHLVAFGELLRVRTNNRIDILADPHLHAIAQYPLAVAIGEGTYVSFSDSSERQRLHPFILGKLSERTGIANLRNLATASDDWRFGSSLRDVLWGAPPTQDAIELENAFLPVSGIVKLVARPSDSPTVVLAAKAGHNNEPHNHNDVGSFIVSVGGIVYLCDPGAGRYSRDYFGPKRYENPFTSSYGHSVPRVAGEYQSPGEQFRGTMRKISEYQYEIDMTRAYDMPLLEKLLRTLTLETSGTVILEDVFRFSQGNNEIEEAFMTWLDVELDGACARIKSEQGSLTITSENSSGSFELESLQEACRENKKPETLKRIVWKAIASPEYTARFAMRFQHVPDPKP